MAAKYASIEVCLSPDQLHASNPGRQAGRQAGARAQHQGSERAERADRNKQTQCHGWARAPVRACALGALVLCAGASLPAGLPPRIRSVKLVRAETNVDEVARSVAPYSLLDGYVQS